LELLAFGSCPMHLFHALKNTLMTVLIISIICTAVGYFAAYLRFSSFADEYKEECEALAEENIALYNKLNGDLNGDGKVDNTDLSEFMKRWNRNRT
jgi:hypothetical protein